MMVFFNFERVLVDDPYHKAEEIYSYIEYYKKNIDKAICVFDEEENGIVYHNTLFILKDCCVYPTILRKCYIIIKL